MVTVHEYCINRRAVRVLLSSHCSSYIKCIYREAFQNGNKLRSGRARAFTPMIDFVIEKFQPRLTKYNSAGKTLIKKGYLLSFERELKIFNRA